MLSIEIIILIMYNLSVYYSYSMFGLIECNSSRTACDEMKIIQLFPKGHLTILPFRAIILTYIHTYIHTDELVCHFGVICFR